MGAVTYPATEVQDLIQELFIPVRIDGTAMESVVEMFDVIATPTFVATDSKNKMHYRYSGFLPPEDFLALMRMMRATVDLANRKYDAAIDHLTTLTAKFFASPFTAEALYQLGNARYKKTGDFDQAVQEWRKLKLSFPKSEWVKKVNYALGG